MACRTRRPKSALLRIVRDPDGRAAPDATGAAPGRGAFVCRRRTCAVAAPMLVGRALRVSLAGQDLDTLRTEIEREIERG
ncbi:MAG: YlxR family protein [Actinomycetota bacterium]